MFKSQYIGIREKGPSLFMRRTERPQPKRLQFPATVLLALLLASSPLYADRIVLLGDSWAWRREASLREVIVDDHGHSNVAISAPEKTLISQNFASPSGLQHISNVLAYYPDTTVIHLSMGANDLSITPEQVGTSHERQIHVSIIANVEVAVDHIWSINPDLKVVWSGYDFFRPRSYPKPAESNEIHMRFGEACADFADRKGPNLIYSDLYGALQVAFGFDGVQHSSFDPPYPIPPGDPSLPDPQWPSPYEAYPATDAEHPNAAGWKALAEAQYRSVYGPLLSEAGFQIDAGLNGNWWNGPDRKGEGIQVEVADGGDGSLVLVATIYTYDDMGKQIFLIAVGTVEGDAAEVEVFITEGGLWGDSFDPALVTESQWGTGTISASSCDLMHMALKPNAQFQGMGYTDLEYDLTRLTNSAVQCPIDA